jgi:hypothetical protein
MHGIFEIALGIRAALLGHDLYLLEIAFTKLE